MLIPYLFTPDPEQWPGKRYHRSLPQLTQFRVSSQSNVHVFDLWEEIRRGKRHSENRKAPRVNRSVFFDLYCRNIYFRVLLWAKFGWTFRLSDVPEVGRMSSDWSFSDQGGTFRHSCAVIWPQFRLGQAFVQPFYLPCYLQFYQGKWHHKWFLCRQPGMSAALRLCFVFVDFILQQHMSG